MLAQPRRTPLSYLKGKFCYEYSETLYKYGNISECKRLLEKSSKLFEIANNLNEEEMYIYYYYHYYYYFFIVIKEMNI